MLSSRILWATTHQGSLWVTNEETQLPETQIEEDNNPTPTKNDSNPTATKNNNIEATSSTQDAVNKRKGRSPAWEHFEKKEIRGQMKAVCIHCKNTLGANNMRLDIYLIMFIYVPCPHTTDVLADALLECMFEWNLDHKLFTLTIDNCSTNDSMIAIVLDKIFSSSLMLDGRLFHMLCCAHILNLVVRDGLEHREPLYKEVPSESDWAKTKELVDKLAMFYDVTVLFSRTKYPTINLYFKNICAIRLAIYDWLNSEQEEVQAMALHMQTKFEKYWDTMHGLMGVASILDPRPSMPKVDLVKQLDVFVSHSTTHGHIKYELEHYLEESLLPRNDDDDDFDILCWWKSNWIKYPTLHDIARDILAILVSTVASESCFSTSGMIISPRRSRLH
ncbi:unnamed protein product [Prunus armeniaca]